MARTAKKETALTAEEKLAQALVPEAEQPYQVPENWCWTKVGAIIDILNGYAFKSEKYVENGIRIIRIANVQDGYIEDEKPVFYPFSGEREIEKYILRENDLLISLTGNVGRVAFLDASLLPAALNQRVGCLRVRNQAALSIAFLYYSLLQSEFQDSCIKNSKGSAQLNMSTEWLKEQPVPLPPLTEQQRIVDRIESLFAKLDEAKEKAQAVVDGFEDRKAAILHKAFTGELTAEWRKRNSVSIKEWRKKNLGAFSFVTKLAGFEYTKNIAPNLVESGIPLFKGKNVQQGKLVLEFESFIPKEVSDELPRSQLKKKCLLTPYVGTIGNIAIFDGSFEAHLGSNVGKIEIESETFEEFLLYYLRSDLGYKELTKEKKATAQESISIQAIRNVEVLLPTLAEQQEIVSILDRFIGQEEQAKETAEQVIDQIDIMKKSILARAFRGELGTNDPTDESAEELLKRVL